MRQVDPGRGGPGEDLNRLNKQAASFWVTLVPMLSVGAMLNRTQRRLGRSPRATRAAVLLRNQCNRVIRYHLTPSDDPTENGEMWLLDAIAPRVRTFVDVG